LGKDEASKEIQPWWTRLLSVSGYNGYAKDVRYADTTTKNRLQDM